MTAPVDVAPEPMTRLEKLRAWISAFEPMPDAPRMETLARPLLNPPTFEEMWATVQKRKPCR